MKNIFKFLSRINVKSIYFNFKYLSFKTAVKLPVLISNKTFLAKCEGSIIINGPVKTAMVQIGYGKIGIFDYKRSRGVWNVSGTVIFNGKTFIGHGSKISVAKTGQVLFGPNFNVSAETSIICKRYIEFGNNCLLSWEILIMDDDLHEISDINGNILNKAAPIIIGNDVWIGCRSTILKGSCIPSNSVIAATSLITKKIDEENCIYGGNPLKILKRNIKWKMN